MDVFTVIYTTTQPDETDSIGWQVSFPSLISAKLCVIEEAAIHSQFVREIVGSDIHPLTKWVDAEDYSTYTQTYSGEYNDSWMIIKTELVDDSAVERRLDSAGLACYNSEFRIQDGEKP